VPQQPNIPTGPAPGTGMPNMNPVTNPTHPAHAMAARHAGAALGHLLTGNGEEAAHHIAAAIGHTIAPHMPEAATARAHKSLKATAHGKKAPRKAKAKS
jgi:hypothetical protein